MQYRLVKSEESQSILCIIVMVAIFFLVILPKIEKMRKQEDDELIEKYTNLNDFHKIDTNICSANCCGSQYPISFDVEDDPRLKSGKYVPTGMTCTGHHGTGCVCVTKEQKDYLTKRGNNH